MVITVLWMIAMTLMNGLACGSHISALWTPPVQNYLKYCIYAFPSLQGFAISNFLLDLLILVLPIPKVRIDSNLIPVTFAYLVQIWSLHATTA